MPPAIRALASLKLTIALLVVHRRRPLVRHHPRVPARGRSRPRRSTTRRGSIALQGLFALNILAALWERWPRNRMRIGFVITHASMLLILVGALVTSKYSVEGRLPLWEGESSHEFLRAVPGGHEAHATLPFAVRLDAFEMDLYPGTQRPAMYRSRITVAGRPRARAARR